jgi:hypothetical protein
VNTTVKVDVVDQNAVTPIRVTISPDIETLNGNDKLAFGATGYDVFGNTIALDSGNVKWSVSGGIGSIENGLFTAAELKEDTTGNVTAEFNGMAASAEITVTKTVKEEEDRTPPAVPTGLKAIPGNLSATLFWNANTESDLAGYLIYDGSDTPILVSDGITKNIPGLEAGREYTYRLAAIDKTGNISAQSEPVTVTPLNDSGGEDISPPEWLNGKLKAKHHTKTGLQLNWTEAVDNRGVESYRIYADDLLIGTVKGNVNTFDVTELESGRTYLFRVDAGDKVNNWSTEQLTLSVKIPGNGSKDKEKDLGNNAGGSNSSNSSRGNNKPKNTGK